MWEPGWRDQAWSQVAGPWDLIVIGGGITGAGILQQATQAGLRALLVEARDFASGTSSRSSKLVHGGLRYLRRAQFRLTRESVRERERLLRESGGLVEPLTFLMANYRHDRPPGWVYGLGLSVYDVLALKWQHRHFGSDELRVLCPLLRAQDLVGGYLYQDARADDARLVLRGLGEAVTLGGVALNYTPVVELLRRRSGQVCGVALRDDAADRGAPARTADVQAPVVINATGVWADQLRAGLGRQPRLRRLRGSHLVIPRQRLPLTQAISFLHPADRRPVFFIPWEGVTLFGTTDVDHAWPLEAEPAISPVEFDYLLAAVDYAFPALRVSAAQVQATFAGVRAVVDTGLANPSAESREHVLWDEDGLLTVTGGKLTTYRLMGEAALRTVRRRLRPRPLAQPPPCTPWPAPGLPPDLWRRLRARYGDSAPAVVAAAHPGDLEPIGETCTCWAELRWAARAEAAVHLGDILLRRVRLGLILPNGALPWQDQIRARVQTELGWDDARWDAEVAAYACLWQQSHCVPGVPEATTKAARYGAYQQR